MKNMNNMTKAQLIQAIVVLEKNLEVSQKAERAYQKVAEEKQQQLKGALKRIDNYVAQIKRKGAAICQMQDRFEKIDAKLCNEIRASKESDAAWSSALDAEVKNSSYWEEKYMMLKLRKLTPKERLTGWIDDE